jgi:hypothetical protein
VSEEVALSGLTIQLRLQTPYDIVLHAGVEKDSPTKVADVMDMLTAIAEREQLKGELRDKKALLRRNMDMLISGVFERNVLELRRQRAEYDSHISAAWVSSSRRGEQKLTGKQKTDMDAFEKQIEGALKARKDVENGIPLTEWQIDCLHARIAGYPEPPMPEALLAVLPEIELPEDVSFTPPIAA